ncbi:MAG: phosphate transport system permease protein [Gammaproteobacteria bacterium]|jgi:phosphate transport system permease protein
MKRIQKWFATGVPYVWLNAGAVTVCVLMVAGLVFLIAARGLGHFWPTPVAQFQYQDNDNEVIELMGEIVDEETVSASRAGVPLEEADHGLVKRHLIKTGNRDILRLDFRWIQANTMQNITYPENVMVIERREWGNFYGFLHELKSEGQITHSQDDLWQSFLDTVEKNNIIFDEIRDIEKNLIGAINYKMERLRLKERGLELEGIKQGPELTSVNNERDALQSEYNSYTDQLARLYADSYKDSIVARLSDGSEVEIPLSKIVRAYQPNNLSIFGKIGFYFEKLWEFVSDDPREANTEGGIFPAIFGTVLMVIIMAILVTPFGVIAAVYLREYATQGPITRLIRISVNNLAGVPSIVYGVFGLGFFVYFLGGSIDQLFFPESLPAPTFGTPGLMWASLTLAILTVPVVIVATEEGLSRVPREIREGSLALGATKAETLWLTVLPMTASAMITGLILAIARAAGEVAPLMLVGVVKLAPSLAIDANAPFLHLDRKFMHLGFHIYDVGFQSPNVEAARPLVYATATLLVLIIIILNLAAIKIRNNLREKYRAAE